MKIIGTNDVRQWFQDASRLAEFTRGIGAREQETLDQVFGVPDHLQFLIRYLVREHGQDLPANALDSIPFHSLCKGLFLPLSMLDPQRCAALFGIRTSSPPDTAGREKLLKEFLTKEVGLTLTEKIGCILGDVFLGKRSSVRRDTLIQLLMTMKMTSRRDCLDRLTQVGDVSVMFAENATSLKSAQPLTAAEVIRTLRFLPAARRTTKFEILRSLYARAGRLEAYFLTRLILQKAGLGFEYQGNVISRLLAEQFSVSEEAVSHAMALTDAFHVADVLLKDGAAGLKKIQLQPLVPVRPMLAGGVTSDLKSSEFPVGWNASTMAFDCCSTNRPTIVARCCAEHTLEIAATGWSKSADSTHPFGRFRPATVSSTASCLAQFWTSNTACDQQQCTKFMPRCRARQLSL